MWRSSQRFCARGRFSADGTRMGASQIGWCCHVASVRGHADSFWQRRLLIVSGLYLHRPDEFTTNAVAVGNVSGWVLIHICYAFFVIRSVMPSERDKTDVSPSLPCARTCLCCVMFGRLRERQRQRRAKRSSQGRVCADSRSLPGRWMLQRTIPKQRPKRCLKLPLPRAEQRRTWCCKRRGRR